MSQPTQVRCTESNSTTFKEGKIYDVIRLESGRPVCMDEHNNETRFKDSKWEPVENGPKFSVGDKVRVSGELKSYDGDPGLLPAIRKEVGNTFTILEFDENAPLGATWYCAEENNYSWDERWLTSAEALGGPAEDKNVAKAYRRSSLAEAGRRNSLAYISGPMTGYPDHNRDRFYEVEEIVRAMGYDVVNPARLDREGDSDDTWTRQDYMRRDIKAAIDCDVFIVFDEWQNSKGATDEAYIATFTGIPLRELESSGWIADLSNPMESVGHEGKFHSLGGDVKLPVAFGAKQLVLGDRCRYYGRPRTNLERIALLWEACTALHGPQRKGLASSLPARPWTFETWDT